MTQPQPPASPKKPVTGRQRSLVISIDKLIYNFSRHWLAVFNIAIAIYVGLPMLAPVLMNAGLTRPANVIYTVYSPMCHQMASRSFFLFGDQVAYPRAIAGTDLTPIEAYMPNLPEFEGASTDPAQWMTFLLAARRFVGNEQMGYKMALCERDIGIYLFILVGGLIYGLLRKRYKIKPLPLWAFLIVGMGPIALDGFSQLFSQYGTASPALNFFNTIFPLRESTPLLRSLTGAIFGLSLVWMAYPHVDAAMQTTAQDLEAKLTRIGELKPAEES